MGEQVDASQLELQLLSDLHAATLEDVGQSELDQFVRARGFAPAAIAVAGKWTALRLLKFWGRFIQRPDAHASRLIELVYGVATPDEQKKIAAEQIRRWLLLAR